MKIKSQRDFFSGLMFVLLGVVFAWASTEYSFAHLRDPGGLLPLRLGRAARFVGRLGAFQGADDRI